VEEYLPKADGHYQLEERNYCESIDEAVNRHGSQADVNLTSVFMVTPITVHGHDVSCRTA
jgi:hypothetical protein